MRTIFLLMLMALVMAIVSCSSESSNPVTTVPTVSTINDEASSVDMITLEPTQVDDTTWIVPKFWFDSSATSIDGTIIMRGDYCKLKVQCITQGCHDFYATPCSWMSMQDQVEAGYYH